MEKKLFETVLEEVKYPIPMRKISGVSLKDIQDLPKVAKIVHFDGDSDCVWVADKESARELRKYGFEIVTDSEILEKREAYLRNEELCQKYPFWLDS